MKRFPSPAGRGPAGRRRPMAPMLAVQAVEPYANGRVLAWAALQQSERDEAFLQEIFADFDSRHHLSAAERALAVDIASGVVRRRRTLDRILESRVARPAPRLNPNFGRSSEWVPASCCLPAHHSMQQSLPRSNSVACWDENAGPDSLTGFFAASAG